MRRTTSTQGEAPYLNIAREIRTKIDAGAPGFGPGDRLPSTAELHGDSGSAAYKRSATTIRNAYGVLIEEGRVVSQPTVGYFVRQYPTLRYVMAETHDPKRLTGLPLALVDGWIASVEAAGYLGRQNITVRSVLGREPLDIYTVGQKLEIGPNDVAVVRERDRYIAVDPADPRYEPESLSTTYYALALVEGTPLMDAEGINTARYLTERGHPQVDFLHEMIARQPNPEEVRRLRLPRGSAVMERITTASTADGRPVYLQHVITAGNGSRFLFRVKYTGDE